MPFLKMPCGSGKKAGYALDIAVELPIVYVRPESPSKFPGDRALHRMFERPRFLHVSLLQVSRQRKFPAISRPRPEVYPRLNPIAPRPRIFFTVDGKPADNAAGECGRRGGKEVVVLSPAR